MPESLATPSRSLATPPAPPVRPRWPFLLFRVLVTCEAALAAGQAVLAGSFLSGHYGALDLHALNATATGLTAVAQTVAALLLWRPGGGPAWPAVTSALLFGAEAGQIAMGYGRVLAVHVPLGVALIACTLLMLVWAWRPASGPSARAVRAEGAQSTESATEGAA